LLKLKNDFIRIIEIVKYLLIIAILALSFSAISAQEVPVKSGGLNYSSAWMGSFRMRSDGWMVGGEYNQTRSFKRSLIYQLEIGEYKHPKQKRQSNDPSGGIFGSDGIRPFVYGKQNNLFVMHLSAGQKHLLVEKARRNGVMLYLQYVGGLTLGLLKPYYLEVCPESGECTFDNLQTVRYIEGNENGFLNISRIVGGAGFGKGWGELKFRPALQAKFSFLFDWSKDDQFIKAIEIGAGIDGYFSKVPIMVQDNKAYFINLYVGITMGKKKY